MLQLKKISRKKIQRLNKMLKILQFQMMTVMIHSMKEMSMRKKIDMNQFMKMKLRRKKLKVQQ